MKKFIINFIIFLILLGFNTTPAFAIKIGLAQNIKQMDFLVSTQGSVIDTSTNSEVLKLVPMYRYSLKNTHNGISVKINGKFYPLYTKNIVIKTANKKGFVWIKNKWYRENIRVFRASDGLTFVNDINLELYLLGVVPSEMPSKWNIEAQKAQAIAARSYAIANMGKRAASGFDLKDTPEDQAYGGASAETRQTNLAVIQTKGQVLVYNNKVISAYYHASAGGKTTNSGEIWCRNLPYLKSVDSFDNHIPRKGHGVGMSQYGANNLANHGYNAYQILAYFYSNVQLATYNR